MKKVILGVASCALILGASGIAAALNRNNLIDVKAAVGGAYLVGDGTFATSSWEQSGGVKLNSSENPSYKYELVNQYLTEGDVFKVKEDSSWYGFNNYVSGGSYFVHTTFNNAAGTKYRVWIEKSALDWFPSGGTIYAHIYNTDSDKYAGWHDAKSAMTYSDGGFYYLDVEATKLYSYIIFSDDKNETNRLDMPDCITSNCYWISGNTNSTINVHPVGWTNKSDNIRVRQSGYYNIYLGYDGKISIVKPLDQLISYVSEKKDEDYTLIDESERAEACQSKYNAAEALYNNLTSADKETFESNYHNLYTAMLNWNTSGGGSRSVNPAQIDKSDYTLVGISAGALSICLVGIGFVIYRRRKAE